MSTIGDIKDEIDTQLAQLQSGGTIAHYERATLHKNMQDIMQNLGAFPAVVLSPATVETAENLDNATHMRVATFSLDIVFKSHNITDNDVENTVEAVMDHFDRISDDLNGTADGGIQPVETTPQYTYGQDYVLAAVIVQAQYTVTIG